MSLSPTDNALDLIRGQPGYRPPSIGVVVGSGLAPALAPLKPVVRLTCHDLPGMPACTVPGHAGELLIGRWGARDVACMSGRVHSYEGHPPSELRKPLRVLRALGCRAVVLFSTVGSINPEIRPGRLALVRDHINLTTFNPLVGINDDAVGPRFPSMIDAYSPQWRQRARRAADAAGIALAEGVMMHYPGPSFETPAEIRAFRLLGGDLVGMSMVPEAIVARHCGLDVLGIGVVANMGAGLDATAPSHEETLAAAAGAADQVSRLLTALMEQGDAAV